MDDAARAGERSLCLRPVALRRPARWRGRTRCLARCRQRGRRRVGQLL